MDLHRLELLLHLSRLGSMREVAEVSGIGTSAVSQQLAALSREVATPLLEPVGRRVRLTPAGQRLAAHAVRILAAVEAARADLDPNAEPSGAVRVAAFATATRGDLLPVARELAARHPAVHLRIHEHEPFEAMDLLAADNVDLALTYDYNLAPATFDESVEVRPLWQRGWALACPSARAPGPPAGQAPGWPGGQAPGCSAGQPPGAAGPAVVASAPEVLARFRDDDWIVNSRNTADEEVVRTVASMGGFVPRVTHRVDNLELVQDLIAAGLGVGLLPVDQPTVPGVALCPLRDPGVLLRAYAVTRRGRAEWPPLALVLDLVGGRPVSARVSAAGSGTAPRPPRRG
ncbi:MAG TPA: LysR family transcriptional regulator [Nocardioidaceae bacterium]|nr:LysR family transcriptional regulator [Nocardioidaceae bacterium]